MSRLAIALTLVATLTSSALAAPTFAKPPPPVAMHAADPITAPVAIAPAEARAPMRVVSRAEVRAKLLANRKANLERFRAYQAKGVFPSNVYSKHLLNVWLDQDGNFCAAATIIRASGNEALVDQVAEDNNFIRLANVRSGPVMDWILTSGLTQAELVAIQKPFRPVTMQPQREPDSQLAIDSKRRARETARLKKLYTQVEAMIVKQQKRSLEAAVDRLMKQPQLAWTLVHGA